MTTDRRLLFAPDSLPPDEVLEMAPPFSLSSSPSCAFHLLIDSSKLLSGPILDAVFRTISVFRTR